MAFLVEVAKVGRGDVVELGANVTAPTTAIFEEGNEGVDVGTTTGNER